MKKNIFCYMSLLAAASLSLTACQGEYEDTDTVSDPANGSGVYFTADDDPSSISVKEESGTYTLPVFRSNTASAATVTLDVTYTNNSGNEGSFSINPQVSFAAGASQADLTITYTGFAYDCAYDVTVKVPDSDYNPYGVSQYDFTFSRPAPWSQLGYGTFFDYWEYGSAVTVMIEKNDVYSGYYRVVDPYAESSYNDGSADPYFYFRVYNAGDPVESFSDFTAPFDGWAYFWAINQGDYNSSYSSYYWAYHPALWSSFRENSDVMALCHATDYLADGTPARISFSAYYWLPDYDRGDGTYGGGYNYATTSDCIVITMPGFIASDYSASIAFAGRYFDVENNEYIVSDVTLGDDVASAKVAVVEGRDTDAAINQVINGTVETIDITASGSYNVPMVDGKTGKYTLIAVTYDAEGNAQEAATYVFNYVSSSAEATDVNVNGLYFDAFGNTTSCQMTITPAGAYTVKAFYGVEGYDLQFTVDQDGTLLIANAEVDDYGYYRIATGLEGDNAYRRVYPYFYNGNYYSYLSGDEKGGYFYFASYDDQYNEDSWAYDEFDWIYYQGTFTDNLYKDVDAYMTYDPETATYTIKSWYGVQGYDFSFTWDEDDYTIMPVNYAAYNNYYFYCETGLTGEGEPEGVWIYPWATSSYNYSYFDPEAGMLYFYAEDSSGNYKYPEYDFIVPGDNATATEAAKRQAPAVKAPAVKHPTVRPAARKKAAKGIVAPGCHHSATAAPARVRLHKGTSNLKVTRPE